MGDYFGHWLEMGRAVARPPRIFSVNWFRKDAEGRFIWPGFGQNMRILKWIFERCTGEAGASETSLGLVPEYDHLDWSGLDFEASRFSDIMGVDPGQWQRELNSHNALFEQLGDKRPERLLRERDLLVRRMSV